MSVFENLVINRIIVHEIFQRNESSCAEPRYSIELAELDPPEAIQTLSDRIISAIGQNSHSIQMDLVQTGEGSVFSFSSPLLYKNCTDEEFITISQKVTNKLSSSLYTKNIPGGAVVIFEGKIGVPSRNYFGIIKAEKHGGFTLEYENKRNLFKYLGELFLSPTQKLYKIAMIINKDEIKLSHNSDSVEVYIFDSQYVQNSSQAAANYFFDTFMGCTYIKTSDVLTSDFYYKTKDFITQKSSLSGEEKVDRMSALYTYLKTDNSSIISVSDFADKYLPNPSLKDAYVSYMQLKKYPMNSFHKDMEKLKHKLKKRKIYFTNDVSIYAPTENFNDYVNIIEKTDNHTIVKIKGEIKGEN